MLRLWGVVLSGCKADAAPDVAVKEPVLGGWELVTGNTPHMMSEKDSSRIETVLKDYGADFEVLDLVATQVVAGANYMYLVY